MFPEFSKSTVKLLGKQGISIVSKFATNTAGDTAYQLSDGRCATFSDIMALTEQLTPREYHVMKIAGQITIQ